MKIYLSPSTVGRYGGVLNGNLRHLNKLIQVELDNSVFSSSFDELWLTLSYPPMYSIRVSIRYKEKEYLINGSDGKFYPNGTRFLVKFACDDPYINETYTKRRIKEDSLNIPDEGLKEKPYQF